MRLPVGNLDVELTASGYMVRVFDRHVLAKRFYGLDEAKSSAVDFALSCLVRTTKLLEEYRGQP